MLNNETLTVKSISVHRAFVYGATAPGIGEFYAGSRIRGLLTASLFIFCGVWFARTLFVIAGGIVGQVFDSLNGITPFVLPHMPFFSMGASLLGLYFIWLWAMISAVDVAAEHRRRNGTPPQASVAWAVAISWLCPGSGHIYTGSRRYGYLIFSAYLLGIVVMIPAYMHLFQSISELADSGRLTPNNPYSVINIIHGLMVRVDQSFGKLYQASVKYFAIAGTIDALRQGLLKADTRWSKPTIGYGAALFGLGWLCPGSGQLLQKRHTPGWCMLAGYIGSQFLIGFLLGHDFVTVQTAEMLDWISILIQWGAMIEAPLWMIREWKKADIL
jgi:hypothetical protein